MFRIQWIDDTAIKVMNGECLEKIIDVNTDEFKLLEYNQSENIDLDEEANRNIYLDRVPIEDNDITTRLIRKSQIYKQLMHFGPTIDCNKWKECRVNFLYENLFSINLDGFLNK